MDTSSSNPLSVLGAVKAFTTDDFDLQGSVPVALKREKGCTLILFYTSNTESINLSKIFALVAEASPSVVYGAVDADRNKSVIIAFNQLKLAENGPLHKFALATLPFILAYQNGFPVAAYNGNRTVQDLSNYTLTLACSSRVSEGHLGEGIQVDDNLGMSGYKVAPQAEGGSPIKTSIDLNQYPDLRGYDPTKGLEEFKPENALPAPGATAAPGATGTAAATAAGTAPSENSPIPTVAG